MTGPNRDSKQSEKDYLRRVGGGAWELHKPFLPAGSYDLEETTQDIQDFAMLLRMLRPEPDDLILDLGAGSCWCSDWLERLNLSTVSVDISIDMLRLGQQRMRSGVDARLITGDLEQLPFAAGSFDKAVCLNALHHVPRLDLAIKEIHRVLNDTGMVLFSEPGVGHADKPWSKSATQDYGVLEQDVPAETLLEACLTAGFHDARLKPISYVIPEFDLTLADWQSWQQFWRRKRPWRAMQKMWRNLLEAVGVGKRSLMLEETFAVSVIRLLKEPVEIHPIVVAYKGKDIRATIPRYRATIDVLDAPKSVTTRDTLRFTVRAANTSSRHWQHRASASRRHKTRLGAQLLDASGQLLVRDWGEASFDHDVPIGGTATVTLIGPAIATPGSYKIKLDVVLEGVVWYQTRGSTPALLPVTVSE